MADPALNLDEFEPVTDADTIALAEMSQKDINSASDDTGKAVPLGWGKPYEAQIGIYSGLARSVDNFQDDFGSNTLTGGIENTLQGLYSGLGTEGQRDWWAQFRQNDNVIRNQLFGATLTPSEQAAYAATSINERMDPAEIRRNLKSRREIVRGALSRKTAFLRAQGYSGEAIDALAGEYAGDFAPRNKLANGANIPDSEQQKEAVGLTPSNVLDAAIGYGQEGAPEPQPDGSVRVSMGDGTYTVYPSMAVYKQRRDKSGALAVDVTDDRPLATDQERNTAFGAVDAGVRGIADTATLGFSDELAAAGDTLFSGGTMQDNLRRQRGQDAQDERVNPLARMGGQFVGAAVLPFGGAEAGAAEIAARGGGYAGGYGFGSSDGDFTDRARDAALAVPLGAAGGFFGAKLLGKLKARGGGQGPSGGGSAQAVADAERFGIDLPMGATGKIANIGDSVLSNQLGSAGRMQAERARLGEQVGDAVENVAGGFGPSTSYEGMGEAAQRGANKWISKFEETSSKAYDAIPISPKAGAALTNSRGALEELTTKFQSNPKLAKAFENSRLGTFMDALSEKIDAADTGLLDAAGKRITRDVKTSGELSWEDLKAFRSKIGEEIGEKRFGDTTSKDELRRLYGALSEDMKASAAAQGPAALRKFERANDLYRKGQERIDTALISILGDDGRKNAESAAGVMQRIAKEGKSSSDIKKLSAIRASMPAEEWGETSNAMVKLLGKPSNGEGRDFSAQTFIRNYGDMSPEAKNLLFGDRGRSELKSALDDFSGVIDNLAKRDAMRNTSNTVPASLANMSIGGASGLVAGGPLGLVLGIGAQQGLANGAARLWTNPKFVRWATGYTKMAAGAAKAGGQPNNAKQMELLSKLAVAEPAIAPDILGLQSALQKAFGETPMKLAAQPQQNDGQR
jgi:hypothetical protein